GTGGRVGLGAAVASRLRVGGEPLAGHHGGTWRDWPAIAGDAKDAALFQPLRDARGSITGAQPDRANVEVEALPLAVEPAEIDDRVMHVGGCSVGIGDDAEPAINGTVVEIEEALRLALTHHVAGIWIGPRDLGLLLGRPVLLLRQRLLAVFGAVLLDRGIQRVPVIR